MYAKTCYDLTSAVGQGDAADMRALRRKGAEPKLLGQSIRPGEGRKSLCFLATQIPPPWRARPGLARPGVRQSLPNLDLDPTVAWLCDTVPGGHQQLPFAATGRPDPLRVDPPFDQTQAHDPGALH